MPARPGAPSPAAAAPERLPGFASGRVSEIQRQRILDSMARACAEVGAANVTIGGVVERSGVSRRTFYELFDDREDCRLAAIEDALDRASATVLPAYRSGQSWRERLRCGLTAFLRLLEEEPFAARLVVVDAPSVAASAGRRRQLLDWVVAAVDEGRGEAKAADPPPLAAEGVVGGALAVLRERLNEPSPVALTGELMSILVLPYLGPAAARRELARPLPEPTARPRPSYVGLVGRLRPTDMRVTYRTVRVLASVAAHPGASNSQLARAAGVQDQGQISKLLTRLERLELIENGGVERGRGSPNSWSLTAKGLEIHRAVALPSQVGPAPS